MSPPGLVRNGLRGAVGLLAGMLWRWVRRQRLIKKITDCENPKSYNPQGCVTVGPFSKPEGEFSQWKTWKGTPTPESGLGLGVKNPAWDSGKKG
jgi:hypothetical protein